MQNVVRGNEEVIYDVSESGNICIVHSNFEYLRMIFVAHVYYHRMLRLKWHLSPKIGLLLPFSVLDIHHNSF